MKFIKWPLFMATFCFLSTAYAQTETPNPIRYYFSFESGPSVSVSQTSYYKSPYDGFRFKEKGTNSGNVFMGIEMVNGISLWDKLKIGLGFGFQFSVRNKATLNSNGLPGIMPFYLAVKYIPLRGTVSPYIEQRGGGVFWSGTSVINPVGGFYSGYAGAYIRSKKRVAGSVGLGYQMGHYGSTGQSYTNTYGFVNVDGNHITSFVSIRAAVNL